MDVPFTVAVNTCEVASSTVGVNGEIVTEIVGTVMVAEADFVASVTEVAVRVTVRLLDGGVAGAV